MNPSLNSDNLKASSIIIEGFICPECQQDMTNADLLHAHFELVHSKNNRNSSNNTTISKNNSSASNLKNEQQNNQSINSKNTTANSSSYSNLFMKQYFNSNQNEPYFRSHTNEFKKLRDNTIGRYVVQTNKLLITLDKLVSIDLNVYTDDNKRDCKKNFYKI